MTFWRMLGIMSLLVQVIACQPADDKSAKSQLDSTKTQLSKQSGVFDLEKQKKDFALTQFNVLDISESEYDKTPALSVSFSVPINAEVNFAQFIQVSDEQGQIITGGWILNESRTRVYFTNIEPAATYKVAVFSGISSITNQQLKSDVERQVETKHLEPKVKFISKGGILPSEMTVGLAIESTNIASVDVNFHRVSNDNIGQVLSERIQGYGYYERNIPEIAELAYTARYDLENPKNKRITTNLPVHQVKQLQQPGFYIAVMKPAGSYPYEHAVTSFYISNLALHTRSFEKHIEIHTLNISQGKPQADVAIQVLSFKGEMLAKGMSDDKGNFKVSRFDNDATIIAQKGNEFAVISLAGPALDLSDQLNITRAQNEQELFLYGPRNLYRPGETVSINGLLRGSDGEMIASVPLECELVRPDSRIAQAFSWHPQQAGFYSREFSMANNEPTGEWILRVKHPGGNTFEYPFSIEEFLPERMKLILTSSAQGLINADADISVKGQGDYLYGAPASGNRASARIQVKPTHFPLETLKDFYFGVYADDSETQEVELDDQMLSDTGEINWMLPNLWKSNQHPTLINFEASLFESGGRPVTRRLQQVVWPEGNHIGLRPLYESEYVKPYQQAEFELINVNQSATEAPLGQLEIALIREDSRYYWRANQHGWDYSENQSEQKIYSRIMDATESRLAIDVPVEYGTYRLEIRNMQGEIKNSYRFFSGWSWDNDGEGSIKGARPDKVRVTFDQESYAENQVAKIKLVAPHTGQALLRVESNQLLWEKQILLTELETQIEVPISSEWNRHDLYFSVMLVAEGQLIDQQFSLPKRSFGIAPLRLNRNSKFIELAIDAPQLSEPEKTIDIVISATSPLSQDTFVTLAAVDTGVLSLANYKTPDAHQWFFGQRSYSANIRDSFSQLIKNSEGSIGKLRFGGDAELVRGGEQPATDVQIVSIFSDVVKFNTDGKAVIKVALPRFNGELRLMALAFSDDRFGHQEMNIKVRAPFVAEVSKPRFLAHKDHSQIAVDLQNMSGDDRQLQMEMAMSGGLKAQKISMPITLANGEKLSKIIDVYAESFSDGIIKFSLLDENKKLLLSRDWILGVRPAYPAEFRQHRQTLNSQQDFVFDKKWIAGLDPQSLKAKVSYSNLPPFSAETHLQHLLDYPYGCLEQTSSRAWPLLSDQTSLENLQLNETSRKILLDKNKHVESAIQRINGMQRNDGSFGMWGNQSEETHWLTVYALDFLVSARKAGYLVPDSVLNKGMERLQWYVKSVRNNYTERMHYSQDPQHYAIAFRAYAAYLLSTTQSINLSQLSMLNNQLADKSRSGLPLAHLAAAFENLGDVNAAKKLWKSAIEYTNYDLSYSGDYGSKIRDLAWIVHLASESKLAQAHQKLILNISDELIGQPWLSTQERFALFRLATDIEKMTGSPWALKISTENQNAERTLAAEKTVSESVSATAFIQKQRAKLVEGEMVFVDLQAVGYPQNKPAKVSKGMDIRKTYYDLQGKINEFSQVKSGEYVLVRLDVIAENRMPNALIVDLLPAGFELENPALEFAYDFSELMIEGYPIYQWSNRANVLHREYRDDRFVAAIALDDKQWVTQFYLMRAVTPGEYLVPPAQVEDMYRAYLRALSDSPAPVKVLAR